MKKIIDSLLNNFIGVILAPIGTSLISKMNTGNWFELLKKYWILIGIVLFVWTDSILVYKRFKNIMEYNNSGSDIFISTIPRFGYEKIGEIEIYDFIWKIKIPKQGLSDLNDNEYVLKKIEIDTPPRCTKCKTKLNEVKTFWGKYKTECVACGSTTKNEKSYYILSKDVKKVVERNLEKEREEKIKNRL